jgi:DNA primase
VEATTLILNNIDVHKILEHYKFNGIKNDGEFIRCCCKIHDGDNPTSFVINTRTGLWFCHSHCGGGDIFSLVEKLENIDFISSVKWLSEFFHIDISNLPIKERKLDYMDELQKFIKVVKSKRKKTVNEFSIDVPIKGVVSYRKFNPETIKHFNLGFVEKVILKKKDGEDYTLRNRLVFPVMFEGIQVGISFRRIKHTDYPKWSHQPANIETGDYLYNYDEAKDKPVITICEGITDVWAFYEIGIPAVACFGAHVTPNQYKLLLKTGADLVFSFDGDDAGIKATNNAIKTFKNKANISTIHLNNGEDPENIDREELKKRYDNRKKM